jgi:hypothetical protein
MHKCGLTDGALIIMLATLGMAACSSNSTETVAAAPAAAVAPVATEPSHPVSDNLTISGPLIVEHQLDVLAQREG